MRPVFFVRVLIPTKAEQFIEVQTLKIKEKSCIIKVLESEHDDYLFVSSEKSALKRFVIDRDVIQRYHTAVLELENDPKAKVRRLALH